MGRAILIALKRPDCVGINMVPRALVLNESSNPRVLLDSQVPEV